MDLNEVNKSAGGVDYTDSYKKLWEKRKMFKKVNSPLIEQLTSILEEKDEIGKSIKTIQEQTINLAVDIIDDTLCTHNTAIVCSNAINPEESVKMDVEEEKVIMNGFYLLKRTDIKPEKNFSGCKNNKEDGKCKIADKYLEWIEGQEWKHTNKTSGQGVGKETVSRENSFMICTKYEGMIIIHTDGQDILDFLENMTEEATNKDDEPIISWLKNIEGPFQKEHFVIIEGVRIGIRPHSAKDGYITVGFGHAIQSKEDAIKYGFDDYLDYNGEEVVKKSHEEITDIINAQQSKFGNGLKNPANLVFQEAEDLLIQDWGEKRTKAENGISRRGLTFNQHEMDAITSLYYNGNKADDPDSLLYQFYNGNKESAMEVLHKAIELGWYENPDGMLRRRLMECNIFYHNDYTFYDSSELETLKEKVGY